MVKTTVMMKTSSLMIAVALAVLPLASAHADETALVNKVLGAPERLPTSQERAAVALAKKWQSNEGGAAQPVAGPNGSVRFLYGAGQPTLVCAVMQVCDVELQPGEQVNSVHLGDSVRWVVEPALSGGVGGTISQHMIIKPLDVGLTTSLVVTTNRRTYHLRLRSSRDEYLPRVGFVYGDEMDARWAAIQQMQQLQKQQEQQKREQQTIPQTGEVLSELDFGYEVSGRAPWKPTRVYNDGTRTIIEMPKSMETSEAPSLLVIREGTGFMAKDEEVLVNYRVQGNRYIVDNLFARAILITGVGRNQTKISIARSK